MTSLKFAASEAVKTRTRLNAELLSLNSMKRRILPKIRLQSFEDLRSAVFKAACGKGTVIGSYKLRS